MYFSLIYSLVAIIACAIVTCFVANNSNSINKIVAETQTTTISQKETIETTEIGDIIVYITDYGKKYHTYGCQYLHSSSNEIKLKDATRRGYEPCLKCEPPVI